MTYLDLLARHPYANLPQGSQQWLQTRGIGSTCITKLICLSGDKCTWENAWCKANQQPVKHPVPDISEQVAVVFGREHEETAKRYMVEHLYSPDEVWIGTLGLLEKNVMGVRWTDSPDDCLVATCDGRVLAMLEVKCGYSRQMFFDCPGFFKTNYTRNYYVQCQWHMFVSSCKYCIFVDFVPDRWLSDASFLFDNSHGKRRGLHRYLVLFDPELILFILDVALGQMRKQRWTPLEKDWKLALKSKIAVSASSHVFLMDGFDNLQGQFRDQQVFNRVHS